MDGIIGHDFCRNLALVNGLPDNPQCLAFFNIPHAPPNAKCTVPFCVGRNEDSAPLIVLETAVRKVFVFVLDLALAAGLLMRIFGGPGALGRWGHF